MAPWLEVAGIEIVMIICTLAAAAILVSVVGSLVLGWLRVPVLPRRRAHGAVRPGERRHAAAQQGVGRPQRSRGLNARGRCENVTHVVDAAANPRRVRARGRLRRVPARL